MEDSANNVSAPTELPSAPAAADSAVRGNRLIAVVLLVMAVYTAAWWWAPGKPALPRRFAQVEPGIFRGGYGDGGETVGRLSAEFGVRTIVTMTSDDPREDRVKDEQAGIERWQLHYFNFPMPGDGRGDFDALEAAAKVLADPGEHPVFFRCAAGKQRSNAVQAVWRMRYCGWNLERTLSELDAYGLDRVAEAPLVEHIRRYHQERIASTQPSIR